MLAIIKKELKLYFYSPTGWIYLSVFFLISGILFSIQHIFSGNPSYQNFLSGLIFILLFNMPILTMRLFAEEKSLQTDLLLLTGPTQLWEIVLGKYLAAISVFVIAIVVTFLYPMLLSFHGDLEWPIITGSYIGFFLLGISFIAVGIFISNIAEGIVGAALLTFCTLITTIIIDFFQQFMPPAESAGLIWISIILLGLLIWIYFASENLVVSIAFLGIASILLAATWFIKKEFFAGLIGKSLSWISLTKRYNSFPLGIINAEAVLYYISFSGFFVFLTIQGLEKRRWR